MRHLDKALYQDFVDPLLCNQLMEAGLKVSSIYCWHYKDGQYILFTLAFDEDQYYQQVYGGLSFINPIPFVNAYQVKDMEKLLPDYLLTKNNNEYELHCSELFAMDVEKSERMPDVFAKMVLKGIRERKIDVAEAIKTITL